MTGLRKFPSITSLGRDFKIQEWILGFGPWFFYNYWDVYVFSFLVWQWSELHSLLFECCINLYSWDNFDLVMLHNIFNMLLNLICQHLVMKLYIYVHEGYLSIVLFYVMSFAGFDIKVTLASKIEKKIFSPLLSFKSIWAPSICFVLLCNVLFCLFLNSISVGTAPY